MPAQSTVDPVKEELNQLIKKKDITEQLIQVYREQAILDEDLILPDGFPRNDIDLGNLKKFFFVSNNMFLNVQWQCERRETSTRVCKMIT